jgi:excisionase family DNA binding protein
MMTNKPWVSGEDVTKHLGAARDFIYRWIESRGLPARKIGCRWKFKLSQVDAWVEAGGRIGSSNAVLVPWSGKSFSAPEPESATAEGILHQTVAELEQTRGVASTRVSAANDEPEGQDVDGS